MKLKIENWLEKQSEISGNIAEVFEDAVKCYKAGIYRPALLLSYLGFLFIARKRLIESKKPEAYPQNQWDNIILKVQNESKWEEEVLNVLKQCTQNDGKGVVIKPAPFEINDDIRTQISYWKDRRNDCAHYKNNEIGESHIIAFWSFLQSKLSYITIGGGLQSLLNKIERFYDYNYTPNTAEIAPLLQQIELIISEDTYSQILDTVISESWMKTNPLLPYYENDKIKPYLIRSLKYKETRFNDFVKDNPNKISELLHDKEEIRLLWKKKLVLFSPNILPLYAAMILADMIPNNEIEEANRDVLRFLYTHDMQNYELGTLEIIELNEIGFYSEFTTNYCSAKKYKESFKEINYKTNMYIGIITRFGFNKDIVQALCENLRSDLIHPYTLLSRVLELLRNEITFKNQFKTIALDYNIELAEDYKFVNE